MPSQVVTLRGDHVPWYQMTGRLMFVIGTPYSVFMDGLWVYVDDCRQPMHDCCMGTLVVKNKATSAGVAPIGQARYDVMGVPVIYQRVPRRV